MRFFPLPFWMHPQEACLMQQIKQFWPFMPTEKTELSKNLTVKALYGGSLLVSLPD